MRTLWIALIAIAVGVVPASACVLCGGSLANRSTLRQEAVQARYVYAGTLSNPRVNAAGANAGSTDFTVKDVLKSDAARKAQKQITIPRYVPVDPKEPAQFLVFCEETRDGQLDAYRGTPVKSPAMIAYLREALDIDVKDVDKVLDHAGKYLDHSDADLASEAFLEFAKSTDAEVMRAAKRLSPVKVRKLLDDAKTPAERLGLYVSMLGACGTAEDADWLKRNLDQPAGRLRGAMSGLYAGLIMLRPNEGWKSLQQTMSDGKRNFTDRLAAVIALRFFYNADPKTTRDQVVIAMRSLLSQEDIADYAVEDLRKWQIWDLTKEVLSLYDRKGFEAPLMRRAILRYALSCPLPEAKSFVANVQKAKPDLVKDVEESLQYEKLPDQPPTPAYNTKDR